LPPAGSDGKNDTNNLPPQANPKKSASPAVVRKADTKPLKIPTKVYVVKFLGDKSAVLLDERVKRETTVVVGDDFLGWTVTKIDSRERSVTLTDENVLGDKKPSFQVRPKAKQ